MNTQLSPCTYCTRVEDPWQCEDKNCQRWRKWFISRWNTLRQRPRLDMEKAQTAPEGVCVGGTCYAPPHRIDDYLRTDPCSSCLCPRDTCTLPCRIKRTWLQTRQNVLEN